MANYFYTDANGKQQGPASEQQIENLVANGNITPTTPMRVEDVTRFGAPASGDARHILPRLFPDQQSQESSSGPFDIDFTRFITNTWISALWVLTIVVAFLGCGIALLFAVNKEVPILILIAPIAAALFLLFMRMSFELTIVMFRIETHLRTIRDKYENK